jgi:electron transfer flavoprotein beta subunit
MKIIVCLKEVIDPAISLDNVWSQKPLMVSRVYPEAIEGNHSGLPHRLNPSDAAALALALDLKAANAGVEITAVSIGEERVESYLRNALALGADKAVRIWDEGFTEMTSYQKVVLLSAFVSLSTADLVLTGVKSLDTANGQVGPMLAARLGFPCVINAVGFDYNTGDNSLTLIKELGRGEREKLRCPFPVVVAVKGEGKLPYAPLDKLIDSKSTEIVLLSPADLSVSPATLENDPVKVTGLVFPRPSTVKAPSLDSSLPAFYRILQLLEGGIAKRKGTILQGNSDALAEQLYQLFLKEGVLKPSVPRS